MMTATATATARPPIAAAAMLAPQRPVPGQSVVAQRIADTLRQLQEHVVITRRVLHAGDSLYQSGEDFGSLHVVHSGFFKTINLAADGREQVVGLHFKGDWLGFDGIAAGRYGCDAVALDTGEVWAIPYAALMQACAVRQCPARDRDSRSQGPGRVRAGRPGAGRSAAVRHGRP